MMFNKCVMVRRYPVCDVGCQKLRPSATCASGRSMRGTDSHAERAGVLLFLVSFFGLGYLIGPATCNDGWHSPSIGRQGACSWHGGVNHTPEFLIAVFSAILGFAVYFWLKWKHEAERERLYYGEGTGKPRAYEGPRCPHCNSEMTRRVATRGSRKGLTFFGCVHFPRCRGTRS